jgi:N-acetylmuramoyl-L-alanine amidase
MDTCIKNRKRRTNNIYAPGLILLFFLTFFAAGFSTVSGSEKTWVVVIDAGHGGKDPGAVGSLSMEKNITLAIALKTGEYLEQNMKNVKVLYTRKSDVFPGLKERAEFANRNKADLFISIHANSISKNTIRGTETYVMGLSKDEQNLEVAMKENEVILQEDDFSTKYEGFDPKSAESYIIFSLMQNVFQEQSLDLAAKIQAQFKSRAGRIDRGVKQAGFWVLYMTSMPSVLVETGFITNPDEEKYLVSKAGQDYLASAIFRAARDYINYVDKKSLISTSINNVTIPVEESTSVPDTSNVDEISFMIQIASSAVKIDLKPGNFKGRSDVIELASETRFRYALGSFNKFTDAVEHRKEILSLFPDAFVIAVKDNKILPLQEALGSKRE